MVFENLTLFEVHLEDANFSSTVATGGEEPPESTDGDPTDGEGPPVGRLLVAGLTIAIAVALLARKLVGGDSPDVDIDAPEDPVDVSLDD